MHANLRWAASSLLLLLVLQQQTSSVAGKYTKWSPASFPNPQKDPGGCGRPGLAASSLCDPDAILAAEAQSMVDGLINQIAEGQSPFKKAECDEQEKQGVQVRACQHLLTPQPAATRARPCCANQQLQDRVQAAPGVLPQACSPQLRWQAEAVRAAVPHACESMHPSDALPAARPCRRWRSR